MREWNESIRKIKVMFEQITLMIKWICSIVMTIFINKDEKETTVVEEIVFENDGNKATLWDEFIVSVQQDGIDEIDGAHKKASDPKLIEKLQTTKGYICQVEDKVFLNLNSNITVVPHIITKQSEPNTSTQLTFIHNKGYLIPSVKTPIGTIKVVINDIYEDFTFEEMAKYFCINPYIFVNKKPINNITTYGNNFIGKTVYVYCKSNQIYLDTFIISQVHFAVNVNIKTKRGSKREVAMITVLIPCDTDLILLGGLCQVGVLAFVIVQVIELKTINHRMLVAASLVKHNIEFTVNVFYGEEVG